MIEPCGRCVSASDQKIVIVLWSECTYGRTEIDSARTVYNNSVFTSRTRIAKRKKNYKTVFVRVKCDENDCCRHYLKHERNSSIILQITIPIRYVNARSVCSYTKHSQYYTKCICTYLPV